MKRLCSDFEEGKPIVLSNYPELMIDDIEDSIKTDGPISGGSIEDTGGD
jgi:hypothetical protein